MNKIRVFIVENDSAFLKTLSNYIEDVNFFRLIGSENNDEKVVETIEQLKPDLVLVDISMPDMSGIKHIYKIKKKT